MADREPRQRQGEQAAAVDARDHRGQHGRADGHHDRGGRDQLATDRDADLQ